MTKYNRQVLVFNCVITLVLMMLIACNNPSPGAFGAESGQASYMADGSNQCVVNMRGRTMSEINADFIWCHRIYDHYTQWRGNQMTSRALYLKADEACVVMFNGSEDESSAYQMWAECVFNRLEHMAESK